MKRYNYQVENWHTYAFPDVDDCDPSPCQNDGTCTDLGTNMYQCDCASGWTGVDCESGE